MNEIISISNLSAGYGSREVIHDLSLSLETGVFYGLIGPNGSGKSTLIDLMMATLAPNRGTIRLRGRELKEFCHREKALDIALVPQDFRINFDFTVYEVVMMGRHPHIPRFANPGITDQAVVDQVLAELEITDLADRLITQLSGGEKQRVIVARALAQATPLLILDEATSSLDIQHSLHIFQVLKRRQREQQITVIAAIHDLNFAAAYCDEIILLNQGRLVTIGPPQEVLIRERLQEVFSIDCQVFEQPFSGAHQLAYRY